MKNFREKAAVWNAATKEDHTYEKREMLWKVLATICVATMMVMVIYVISDTRVDDAEVDLFNAGVELYNEQKYDAAYDIFELLQTTNKNLSSEKLNKKFKNISQMKEHAYDHMLLADIYELLNTDEPDYKGSLEIAYTISDYGIRNGIVEEIIYAIEER